MGVLKEAEAAAASWILRPEKLLSKLKRAEAENAKLRERLRAVDQDLRDAVKAVGSEASSSPRATSSPPPPCCTDPSPDGKGRNPTLCMRFAPTGGCDLTRNALAYKQCPAACGACSICTGHPMHAAYSRGGELWNTRQRAEQRAAMKRPAKSAKAAAAAKVFDEIAQQSSAPQASKAAAAKAATGPRRSIGYGVMVPPRDQQQAAEASRVDISGAEAYTLKRRERRLAAERARAKQRCLIATDEHASSEHSGGEHASSEHAGSIPQPTRFELDPPAACTQSHRRKNLSGSVPAWPRTAIPIGDLLSAADVADGLDCRTSSSPAPKLPAWPHLWTPPPPVPPPLLRPSRSARRALHRGTPPKPSATTRLGPTLILSNAASSTSCL